MKPKIFHKYRIFILALAVTFVTGTYFEFFQSLENWGYGLISYQMPEPTRDNHLVVVAIDNDSIKQIGAWPWPRTEIAKLLRQVASAKPKSTTLMLDLATQQTPMKYSKITEDLSRINNEGLRSKLHEYLTQLDTDRELVDAIATQRQLILSAFYRYSSQFTALPSGLASHLVPDRNRNKDSEQAYRWLDYINMHPTMLHVRIQAPDTKFIQKTAVGLTELKNSGQAIKSIPLLVQVNDQYLPSLPLVVAAFQQNIGASDIKITSDNSLVVGKQTIKTAMDFRYYPRVVKDWDQHRPIRVISASKLNKSSMLALQNKHVIIGLTADVISDYVKLPNGAVIAIPIWQAYISESLIRNQQISVPYWFYAIQRGLIILFALILFLLPMRFYRKSGFIFTLVVSVVLLNTGVLIFVMQQLWIPLITPTLFFILTQTLIFSSYRKTLQIETARMETTSVRRELGSYYQSQGNLQQAYEHFRACLNTPDMAKSLYTLGLDFERRRQFDRALDVYEHIHHKLGTYYNDSDTRITRLQEVTRNFPSSSQPATAATQIMMIEDTGVEKPLLGRYQLERELGRGAMGMVYLGRDPKIGRKVAIKTLALGEEFEGKALEESEKRFFREAEAVGRLNHPNIVTIFDVGEDQGLAYIAMDFIEGDTLAKYMFKDDLLKIPVVIDIGIKVAEALAYAHKQKVIHRDIKPANIMYNPATNIVKVTDFGIAALTDDTKTKTGTVLGSPSYMSPEQITAKKVNGQSDQFSLAVTLYQLLTGRLPFEGDSIANLMFQITNQPHRPIRKVRRGIPACVSRVINKSLQKQPDQRFPDCLAMAEALRKCIDPK